MSFDDAIRKVVAEELHKLLPQIHVQIVIPSVPTMQNTSVLCMEHTATEEEEVTPKQRKGRQHLDTELVSWVKWALRNTSNLTHSDIGDIFNISATTVGRIKYGKTTLAKETRSKKPPQEYVSQLLLLEEADIELE